MSNQANAVCSLLLISCGFALRVFIPHPPNVELVTVATFLAALYLGKKSAIIVPLVILILSDMMLGNTSIFFFTWSAYFIIGISSSMIKRFNSSIVDKLIASTIGGGLASIWFYLWTNFGVWLLDSWGMYPNTINRLFLSYVNGLPFLRNQLVGNLLFVPMGVLVMEVLVAFRYEKQKSFILGKKYGM